MAPSITWPGWRVAAPDRARNPDGRLRWLLQLPAARRWTGAGVLEADRPVPFVLEDGPDGAVLRADRRGAEEVGTEVVETDVVELDAETSRSLESDRSAPLTVLGSFAPLGGPAALRRFLVGGSVLDTNQFGGRRCPSEQTALSLYRIARWRGGPFWEAVADHVAGVVADRVEAAPDGLVVHDLWGEGECHARFLSDAALLLIAEAERRRGGGGPARAATLAARALGALESLAVSQGGGRWYLHDTAELRGGRNQLVLNTHVHALVARAAAGEPISEGLAALDAALALRPEGARALALTAVLAASDAARAVRRPGGGDLMDHLALRGQEAAARSRSRRAHLRLPGGWLARDAGPGVAPGYFTVNLADLAVLSRVGGTRAARRALVAGLVRARLTGFFRAQRREGDPLAVLVPSLLVNAGFEVRARRAAQAVRDAGWPPTIGWPDHRDHLWARLPEGTP
ncbi:MAG: hypothetical protein ACYDAD_07110 [Acidimicrobiales bacterium]